MNAQAIPLAGHSSAANYANSEGARQLVQQNLQKRTNMRSTGNNQPAAVANAKKSSTALKPMQMKSNEGKIACLMSFVNVLLEVLGVVKA